MSLEQILLVLVLLAAIVAALGAWRRRGDSTAVMEKSLAELERRLAEAVRDLRDSMERQHRESLQAASKSQQDLTLALTDRINESSTAARETLGNRFQETQKLLSESLAASRKSQDERLDRIDVAFRHSAAESQKSFGDLRAALMEMAKKESDRSAAASDALQRTLISRLDLLRDSQAESLSKLQELVQQRLDAVRKDNEEKLEKIRATVEEKLQTTLETRLGESFKMVSERLEQVHKGLGEMQTLAAGVGDLKKVLTNVRSRGTFGEVQLESLLQQLLTPAQYARNARPNPASDDIVEFAIVLPSPESEDRTILLPIDAKFPQEDYLRLLTAYENDDAAAVNTSRLKLRTRLLQEARKIREKYICPPHTTDMAILFVPTEGLFAEALRLDGVEDEFRNCNVLLAGPTNLYAVVSSLQIGLRAWALQRRSDEVWRILGAVKTEFGKFGESLDAVKKKLQEASNKIDSTQTRTRQMARRLREVESLPEKEVALLLPLEDALVEDAAVEDEVG